MPVESTEQFFDPNDPDDYLARRYAPPADAADTPASPWVEPDYASIPSDAELPADEDELRLVWPGPAMIMSAGLLPDGKPPAGSELDTAARICGERPRNAAEADAVWWAFLRQQRALRDAAGLPRPTRGKNGKLEDAPETLAAIERLHREERMRRAARRRAG
jgi:hypothetical protein